MKNPTTLLIGSVLLTAALASCGGQQTTPPAPTPPPAGDTTAPSVVSVSPADGATGVAKDAPIVVTFSEPMNQGSAQAAFQSATLGPATFSWNTEGTVMTVKPNAALAYTSSGKAYTFSETTTATDRAGNALGSDTAATFKTYREITATLNSDPAVDGMVYNNNDVYKTTSILAGDFADNSSVRGFTSFDLSSLPDGLTPDHIEKASLRMYVANITGSPFSKLFPPVTCTPYCFFLGKSVVVESVNFGPSLTGTAFDTTPLGGLTAGLYGESSGPILLLGTTEGWNSGDVSAMLRADWQEKTARGARSQYRLKFPLGTNSDDKTDRINVDSARQSHKPQLVVTYLIP